jgi:class 3 adenylate cyclase
MTAGLACGSCGTGLREDAKFCDACGSPTAGSVDTATYKQVTVLFADVVRSTDIAAAIDIERLREIMTELLEGSATVVQRYGGTVEYNGDGVMALFGAPVALEDHAFRGCLAALAIQEEANRLAAEVQRRDGVTLRLRVGLHSGRVIAGEIGSGSLGYAATGETVGFAQRMESVAPPGGVMLSESTARLVEHTATLAEPEWVRIKGAGEPVRARRLVATGSNGVGGRTEGSLIGRRWEMAALDAIVDRAISGRGGVISVVGPPGIGKSRVAREAAAMAADRGVEVFWAFCESHARDVPFHAAAQLLRASRELLRAGEPDADPQDLLLLDDLLGIADPEMPLPQIDPDARRRRLTALINTASLARRDPVLFVIEDAHWVDGISESMLADFLTVISRTQTIVLITARPEYGGALVRARGAQTIALAPLGNSDIAALLGQLLGADPSVTELATIITERADGNPFFAEEMVRELVQRGELKGDRGNYLCHANAADVAVPATVQAAIGARIDRLNIAARQTLNAASVIGARFDAELLTALSIEPVFDELLGAELIDQVRFTPRAEYAFRHPLIRSVAYESQLKSDRAQWHRRLAAAIQESDPGSVDENAALIAEHLESAGELHVAYSWRMRAAAWTVSRDPDAARVSWERACRIADALPADDPARLAMRIAPRTMLCATDWQDRTFDGGPARFAELQELCTAAGDKVSLAIGITGQVANLLYAGRSREGALLSTEQMALLESMDNPLPIIGLAFGAFCTWLDAGEMAEILRWSETVVDLTGGDPTKGAGFGAGSPLAAALVYRGVARWWLGRPGWRSDIVDAVAIARRSAPMTFAAIITWAYSHAMHYGVLRSDESAVCEIEEALPLALATSNGTAVALVKYTLAIALLKREAAVDRDRGLELMLEARDLYERVRAPFMVLVSELWIARERALRGDSDGAIPIMRHAVDELHRAGRIFYGVWGAGVLVETLLERSAEEDLAEAQEGIDRLATLTVDRPSATVEITELRLRALLARARGDDLAFKDLASRYHEMAESLGFEGHTAWAGAMNE